MANICLFNYDLPSFLIRSAGAVRAKVLVFMPETNSNFYYKYQSPA